VNNNIIKDLLIILLSVILAIFLVKTHAFEFIINGTNFNGLIGSFVAGLFFTSVFTVAPATVALGEISQTNNIFLVVVLGGLGAMVGDYVIFKFFKNRIGADLINLIKDKNRRRLKHILHSHIWKRILAILGALIIASPLPDELGLMLMGMSKLKNSIFFPVSFLMNSLGILIIALIANL